MPPDSRKKPQPPPGPGSFHFPPAKNKKQAQGQTAYRNYINAHPYLRGVSQWIYSSAINQGIDPVYFASLISFESAHGTFRQHPNANPTGHGWAQINPKFWVGKADPRDGHTITMNDLNNDKWNIEFGAYIFGRGLRKANGSYDAAYRQTYNPNFHGKGPFQDLPKGYVSTVTAKSPTDAAHRSVETDVAKKNITDPYVRIDKHGKLVNTDQAHAIMQFGQPMRRSIFTAQWQDINDIYLAYTGKPVTARAMKDILSSGKSKAKIVDILTRGPNFQSSPVWKQNAPGYEEIWKSIYGQDSKPDPNALRYGIVNNLGSSFGQYLRDRPDYETSQEFKGNMATMSGVYTKIYGVPDGQGSQVIHAATKQGQTPDMFANYLRSQPEYQYSGEFKSRTLGLANALGFITGQQATLSPGGTQAAPTPTPEQMDPNAKPAGVLS